MERFKTLPRWLKVILTVLSIITVVYWVFFLIYQILKAVRCICAYIFQEDHYWTFIICIILILVGIFIAAQFVFGLDPVGKFVDWIADLFEKVTSRFEIPKEELGYTW